MQFTKKATVTTTGEVVVLDVPVSFQIEVTDVFVVNHDNTSNNVDLYVNDGTTNFYFFEGKSLTQNDRDTLGEGFHFIMHNGDELRVQTSGAGNVAVFVTGVVMPSIARYMNFI